MTSKIFRSTVFVAVIVLLCSLGVIMGVLYSHFSELQIQQLKDELSLAVTGTEQYGNAFLENIEPDIFRITWIDSDGTVLFDTQVDSSSMPNHADREEFKEALTSGSGSSIRSSDTLTEQTYYEARILKDGTVLRISTSQKSAWFLTLGMLQSIILITVLAIALSAFLARRMAKRIVEPLNTLDLENPLKNVVYPELTPLLHRINEQHNQIALQIQALHRSSEEFEQITENMQEGLVLLDSDANVLSINSAAKRLFNAYDDCIGKSFLSFDLTDSMRDAVSRSLNNNSSMVQETHDGHTYQFDLNCIESDGAAIGTVVLAFDITERSNSEQLRREFSANVSHELKTPLQSIIGSAELIENGLVKPEDTSRFIGHIRKEASRLVSLIEDIIRLSQLDEGAPLPVENVDMLELSNEVKSALASGAEVKNISIEVSGNGFIVTGVRQLLYEIVYNLCDNAIKYNVENGSVRILAENSVLSVSDTGIGIPYDHQGRVFERFYRVDKSHSKASGGTGLGLSIVKHAAAYHNAKLSLESTPGKGTVISVSF